MEKPPRLGWIGDFDVPGWKVDGVRCSQRLGCAGRVVDQQRAGVADKRNVGCIAGIDDRCRHRRRSDLATIGVTVRLCEICRRHSRTSEKIG